MDTADATPSLMPDPVSDAAILLVEDDHGDAVLVQACLDEAGVPDAAVTWTRTLADALQASSTRPTCVLLDLGLPDADGFSAVHKMVEAVPDAAVIVLTGRQERDGVDALAAGAQDYLVKDAITAELLERSVRYAIERKRAQRTQQQLRDIRLSAAEQARLERGLLPTPRLTTGAVDCATYYRPGSEDAVLGGDFFDVLERTDGMVRAVIGDVMGHGPDEAALGVHLRVSWRALVLAGLPDEQILPALARLLEADDNRRSHFATVCDVTIDGNRLVLRVAGHPAPVLSAGGESTYLAVAVGAPVGVRGLSDATWPATTIDLPPDATVLLYTDGLLDAYGSDDDESIGVDGLVVAVQQCLRTGQPPGSWIPMLLESAPRESIDDTAVVVLTAGR